MFLCKLVWWGSARVCADIRLKLGHVGSTHENFINVNFYIDSRLIYYIPGRQRVFPSKTIFEEPDRTLNFRKKRNLGKTGDDFT